MKTFLGFLLFALSLNARAMSLDELRAQISAGQKPYEVLKSLYETSQAARIEDFDLFGHPSDRLCAIIGSSDGDLLSIESLKRYVIKMPSRGPLFPTHDQVKLVSEKFDKASPLYLSAYDSEDIIQLNLDAETLAQMAGELVFHLKASSPPAAWTVDTVASFRKSGDLLAFKFDAPQTPEYGYCWREPSAAAKSGHK